MANTRVGARGCLLQNKSDLEDRHQFKRSKCMQMYANVHYILHSLLPGFSKLVNLVTPLANQPSAFLVVNLSKQHPSTSSWEIIENHRKQGRAGGIWWCHVVPLRKPAVEQRCGHSVPG